MKTIKILALVLVLGLILAGCGKTAGNIELKPKAVNLTSVGGKSTLAVSIFDTDGNAITDNKQPIVWTTDKPDVATVVDGKVTAVGSGKAVITATLGNLKTTASVNVSIISSIAISPGSMKLAKGDKNKFTVVVKDEKGNVIMDSNVSWSSKNTDVAIVNKSGGVMAKGKGKTVIKAVVAGKAATASVEVAAPEKDKDSKVGGIKTKGKPKPKVGGIKLKSKNK